jgi:beta-ribofuranosylaminobenzene 5'-phosphate synthase
MFTKLLLDAFLGTAQPRRQEIGFGADRSDASPQGRRRACVHSFRVKYNGIMIQVRAHGRLHFGLLNPPGTDRSGPASAPSRCFGGVGLMIAQPDLLLRVEPASTWSAEGPLAERALEFAQRFADAACQEEQIAALTPHRLLMERLMPVHAGLGSGTQLGLSVARALSASCGLSCDVAKLALRVGRGLRSALGAHGFELGGFLVEAGKRWPDGLAPLVVRHPFPDTWRLVVALPSQHVAGRHGRDEEEAFAQLAANAAGLARTEVLCRLVLLGLLPALIERDVDAFGEALYEFNVRVGEAFAPVQGGVYASPQVAELVAFLRGQHVRGVGQSSWGPAVFGVVADAERAEHLAAQLRRSFALPQTAVWTTSACNHGATLEQKDQPQRHNEHKEEETK